MRTSNDGAIYWGDQRLSLRDSVKQLKDKPIPKEMPVYGHDVTQGPLEEDVDRMPCRKDNGHCSDICNPPLSSMRGVFYVHGNPCSCGNGRIKSKDYIEYSCVAGSGCAFRCTDGECINHLDVCDGVTNCDWGEDERNCTEELKYKHWLRHLENEPGNPEDPPSEKKLLNDIRVAIKDLYKGEGSGATIFLLSLMLICTVLGFTYALFHKTIR